MENKKFPVCFQEWNNGMEKETSGMYWSGLNNYSDKESDFEYFQNKHWEYREEGNTHANLIILHSEEELNNYFN